MFTSMVGVELTHEMVDINQRTDDLKAEVETRFEAVERVEESLRGRLEGESASRVRLSHRVEILEEARLVGGLSTYWSPSRTRGGWRRRG